jgi:hypothetical protein
MALTKAQKTKAIKDVTDLWKESPAKALKLLVKLAKFKGKSKRG